MVLILVASDASRCSSCWLAGRDGGITFFDTANVYGRGAAEQAWGEILADYPRDSYVLATKAYFPMSDTDRGSRAQIHKQLDASLKRLNTDHVDLFQCHRYDDATPLEETMQGRPRSCNRARRATSGSEWPAERIRQAIEMPGVTRFVSSQPQYSRSTGPWRPR
jgi:aryl-alcohol dehydrogenase-like predicted oxidoreductase